MGSWMRKDMLVFAYTDVFCSISGFCLFLRISIQCIVIFCLIFYCLFIIYQQLFNCQATGSKRMATQPHQSPFLALELSRLQLTLGMEESQPRLLFHKSFSGD